MTRPTRHRRAWLRPALSWGAATLLVIAIFILEGSLWPSLVDDLASDGYRVVAPEAFWGLLAIPGLVGLTGHSLSDLPWAQRAISLLLKSSFVALAVLALVDLRTTEGTSEGTAVVYVVDVSESVPDAMLEGAQVAIQRSLDAASILPLAERPFIRVVTFAKTATEVPLASGADGPQLLEAFVRPAPDAVPGTDIGAGIARGLSLLPDGRAGRLVLVTDGHRTQGSFAADLETLKRFDVPVDYLSFADLPLRRELMVLSLVATGDNLKPKIPFEMQLTVDATVPMAVICKVTVESGEEATQEVALSGGRETISFELTVAEGGEKSVTGTCTPAVPTDDSFDSNNTFPTRIALEEKPRVLYVEGETRMRQNLITALNTDFEVETRGARGTPATFADASKFDAIIISDVPRLDDNGLENMTASQMGVLERYATGGGGLIITGGENALGPGGYGQTALERSVLPVRLDVQRRQDTPGLALVLVIDRSGSMSGPKLELAKQAAIETLNVLQPSDLLGVFPFDTRVTELVPLQRASNRFRITDTLSKLKPGGGTNIFAGLDAAYTALLKVEAKVKHIILLTDGQSSRTGVVELATQAGIDRITISTVAVTAASDTSLLRRVAEAARGRYYFTNSPQQLPQLFLKETSEVTRKAIVEGRFRPRVSSQFRTLQMFSGIDFAGAPPLLGYVSTRPKPRAEVLMTSHLGEPLLARWRLGLGRVVVWTSDVKNKWSHHWLGWGGYAKFWRQVVRDQLRVDKGTPVMNLETAIEGDTLVVSVDAIDADDRFIDGMTHTVDVTGPEGATTAMTMRQVAAGRYEGRMTMPALGPYSIKGSHRAPGDDDGDVRESRATVAWPFPDERLVGPPRLQEVAAMANATGGLENPSTEALIAPRDSTTVREKPIWPTLIPWMLIALILDVLMRRVRIVDRRRGQAFS